MHLGGACENSYFALDSLARSRFAIIALLNYYQPQFAFSFLTSLRISYLISKDAIFLLDKKRNF